MSATDESYRRVRLRLSPSRRRQDNRRGRRLRRDFRLRT
jgi:hypothetical protein